MIGALVSIISLNLTLSLIQDYGVVAGSLPITGATTGTPIAVMSPGHGVPPGRVVHGIVSGVVGMVEANGLWVLTPKDENSFTLSTFTAQGIATPSTGTNTYLSGGTIQYAFPDYAILLGRRNVALSSSVASPRVVFVPTNGKAWDLEPYGGVGAPAEAPPIRGSLEAQAERTEPQLATEFVTFEVTVSGSAKPPDPDFGDFDATQQIVHALYAVLFDATGPARARVLREGWPSQTKDAGPHTQRGQQWAGIIEMQEPVRRTPVSFVPIGTSIQMTVEPVNPLVPDDQTTFPIL